METGCLGAALRWRGPIFCGQRPGSSLVVEQRGARSFDGWDGYLFDEYHDYIQRAHCRLSVFRKTETLFLEASVEADK